MHQLRFSANERVGIAGTGAWQAPESFDILAQETRETYGVPLFCPRLSIEDKSLSHPDYALRIVDFILKEKIDPESVDIWAHSRFGNAAPLVAEHLPIERIVYFCAIIPPTIHDVEVEDRLLLPPRYGQAMDDANIITDPVTGLESYNPETAPENLFNCSNNPKLVQSVIQTFRPNRSRPPETVLYARPKAEEYAIFGSNDLLFNIDWGKAICLSRLQKAAIEQPFDHMPHIDHPRELAPILIYPERYQP